MSSASVAEAMTIIGWYVSIGGEEKVASGMAGCFGFAQIAGITVDSKDHVADIISENGIFLSSGLFQGAWAGLADWDAMALMGHKRVGSTARPRKINLPQTFWMNFLPLESRGGNLGGSVAYCILVPYLIGVLGNGEC